MSVHVELWDKYEFGDDAGAGSRLAILAPVSAVASSSLLNDDTLTVVITQDDPCISDLDLRKVLRVVDSNFGVSEYRISEIEDGTKDESLVTILARSPLYDLADTVIAFDTGAGSADLFNLGAIGTAENIWTWYGYAPAVTTGRMIWFNTETFTCGDQDLQLAWDHWTPLQLLQELAGLTGGEIQCRRAAESGLHYISLQAARGSTADTVLLHTDRNVRRVRRRRRIDPYRNAIIPLGATPSDGFDAAGLGRAVWEVTATATGAITIADPQDNTLSPVAFADQLNGYCLLKTNAALATITDSTIAGVITCDVSNVAVGDHVEIREDADANLLTELQNPAQVTAYGRVVGTYEVSGARGERNHIPNADFRTWVSNAYGMRITLGACSNTQVPVSGLASGTEIKAGDRLVTSVRLDGVSDNGGIFRIVGDVTATDGTATVTVAVNCTVTDASPQILARMGTRLPTSWTIDDSSSAADEPIWLFRRDANTCDGVVSTGAMATDVTNTNYVTLTNLTAGTIIYPGDVVVSTLEGYNVMAVALVTADGSGVATIPVFPQSSSPPAPLRTVYVTRPNATEAYSGQSYFACVLGNGYGASAYTTLTTAPYLSSPTYRVKYDTNYNTLWGSVGLALWPVRDVDTALTTPATGTTSYPPQFGIVDASGTVVALATVTDVARALTGATAQEVTLRCSYVMSADTTVGVRLKPPLSRIGSGAASAPEPLPAFVRWVSLYLTYDETTPFVYGSYANTLWHAANNKLLDVGVDPVSYEIGYLDLARMAGWTASHEQLVIGGNVRLVDADRGIDDTVRVVGLRLDLLDPSNSQVMLESIPTRLAQVIAKQKAASKQWVAVNVAAAGADADIRWAQTQTAVPYDLSGATRT